MKYLVEVCHDCAEHCVAACINDAHSHGIEGEMVREIFAHPRVVNMFVVCVGEYNVIGDAGVEISVDWTARMGAEYCNSFRC